MIDCYDFINVAQNGGDKEYELELDEIEWFMPFGWVDDGNDEELF